MIELVREEKREEVVRTKIGALHITAYRGGVYEVYGAGQWTAHVHAAGVIIAKATAPTEHEAIAKALREAEAVAAAILQAVAAARAEVP